MKKIVLFFALSISNSIFADTLLHVGNLLDTNNGEIQKAVTIRIKGNQISEITKGYASPNKNDAVVNLKQSYVLPGFMDMHVHLTFEYAPKAERELSVEPEFSALFAANAASKTLVAAKVSSPVVRGILMSPQGVVPSLDLTDTGAHTHPLKSDRRTALPIALGRRGAHALSSPGPAACATPAS